MRLRVVWNNVRLVVSYSNPGGSAKVSDLLDHVAAALKRAGVSFDADNRFQHLSLGGFIVSSNDLVADVIENNDVIEVTDYYGWIAEKRALAKHSWVDINARDHIEDTSRWASVGATTDGRLFIKLGREYSTTNRLEFFTVDDLKSFGKNGKQLVARLNGTDWFCEASFLVEGNIVREMPAVELAVKASSDNRACIKQVEIVYKKSLEAGKETLLQEAFTPPSGKVYTVPPNTATGPTITSAEKESDLDDSPVPEVVSTGDAPFEFRQIGNPFVEQDWNSDGTGFQKISTNFLLNHKGDEQVTIVLLSAEWLNGDAWEPCKAASGHKDSDYYYSIRNAPDTLLAIEPKSVEKLALRATIPISGHHYEHQRLLHSSFKTDVKVRFVITEANGKKATIVINVPKRPPFLRTREALAAEKPNVFLWASCDDTVAQMRLWVGGYQDKDGIHFINKFASTSQTFNRDSLRGMAFTAAAEGKSEVPVGALTWSLGEFSISGVLLVDLGEKYAYGVRVTLKTLTGTSTTNVVLPTI